MKKERQGEIAVLILKENIRQKGLNLRPVKKKEFRKKARRLGIPTKEAREFARILIHELVDEFLSPKKGKKGKK